jgi:hypothetical protein
MMSGIPEYLIKYEDLESPGFQLVTSLADQLDGKFELKRDNEMEFTMRFTETKKDNLAQAGLNHKKMDKKFDARAAIQTLDCFSIPQLVCIL